MMTSKIDIVGDVAACVTILILLSFVRCSSTHAEPTRPPPPIVRHLQLREVPSPPEDRLKFTSPEWWLRENARVGKAMIICGVC
jgi:hypothetical protein